MSLWNVIKRYPDGSPCIYELSLSFGARLSVHRAVGAEGWFITLRGVSSRVVFQAKQSMHADLEGAQAEAVERARVYFKDAAYKASALADELQALQMPQV